MEGDKYDLFYSNNGICRKSNTYLLFICRCTEQVKNSQYIDLANDLEIDKAIMYLKQKDFNEVSEQISMQK